jgi:hypothetical protein
VPNTSMATQTLPSTNLVCVQKTIALFTQWQDTRGASATLMQTVTRMQKRMVQPTRCTEKGQEANVSNIALVTKHVINDDCNSLISDSEMMTEVCCFEQSDYSTEKGTSSSHDLLQVHINLDNSVTHHLNELTLDAFQHKVATNFLSHEFIDAFTQYNIVMIATLLELVTKI